MNKPGRNELCLCGSGRKYKKCCLARDEQAAKQTAERMLRAANILRLAVELHQAGRLAEAEDGYRQVLELEPANADALNLLGGLHSKAGRHSVAAELISLALTVSKHPLYYNSLGNAKKELRDLPGAANAYHRAIELKPDYFDPHNNLGVVHQQLGNFELAVESYKKALSIDPQSQNTLFNLGMTLKESGNTSDAILALSQSVRLGGQTFAALASSIQLAVLHYLNGNKTLARSELERAEALERMSEAVYRNPKSYFGYLKELLKIDVSAAQASANSLYAIGDSHVLSAAGVNVHLEGVSHQCVCGWIEGCKQWHLANSQSNKYKAQFLRLLKRIPRGSKVLLLIGEIDARPDEGVLKAWRARSGSLEELAVATAEGYMSYVVKHAQALDHEVLIGGVPATNMDLGTLTKERASEFLNFLGFYNTLLADKVRQAGMKFVDLYSMTNSGDGSSNKRWHIDVHHLVPDAVREGVEVHCN